MHVNLARNIVIMHAVLDIIVMLVKWIVHENVQIIVYNRNIIAIVMVMVWVPSQYAQPDTP